MPRRSQFYRETPEEQKVRVLKQTRELTNFLKTKLPQILTWDVVDEDDLRRIESDLTGLKRMLPKRAREYGDWEVAYKAKKFLDMRVSLISYLARDNNMKDYVPLEDQRKLNAAVETALDALQTRLKDDEALALIAKLRDTQGRTEEEVPQFLAKADDIESRRRWSGGGAHAQPLIDYLRERLCRDR